MAFAPAHCPNPDCPSHLRPPFRFHRRGTYHRACDGRLVPRFLCARCRRSFSAQTFRLDYRLRKPALHLHLWRDLVSKVTHRQAARTLGVSRHTVAHRLRLLSEHCRLFHRRRLRLHLARGGLQGAFQLDELETFEHNRRLSPVTVPVLVERRTRFVASVRAAPLPARGRLNSALRAQKRARDAREGVRRSGSTRAVESCLRDLRRASTGGVWIESDRKATYPGCVRRQMGPKCSHDRLSSKMKGSPKDPLFPVNHVLAQLRDGVSRLVRRSWGAAKLRERLEGHLWVWVCYRNYMRPCTNRCGWETSAMALGVEQKRWTAAGLFRERIFAWREAAA